MMKALLITPQSILFKGECVSIVLPAEEGEMEILSYHKDFLSRLLPGTITIDHDAAFSIRRGIVKIERNTVTIIAEAANARRA